MKPGTHHITRRAALFAPVLARKAAGQGQAKETVEFCGRSWEIKTSRLAGPGPNRFARENVVVKPDGMHLRIRQDAGSWTCAEAICSDRLGFGRYTFEVGDVSHLDVNMVLGLFSWAPMASAHHFNEVDIELGRWGNAGAPNAQFVLQPWDVQGNRIRFDVPKGGIEYSFEWSSGRVACRAAQGASTIRESLFEKGVPSPEGAQARMNFWLFQSRPPQRAAEVVVKRFHFTAME